MTKRQDRSSGEAIWVSLALAGIVLVSWLFLLAPQARELRKLEAEEKLKSGQLARKDAVSEGTIQEMQSRIQRMEALLAALEQRAYFVKNALAEPAQGVPSAPSGSDPVLVFEQRFAAAKQSLRERAQGRPFSYPDDLGFRTDSRATTEPEGFSERLWQLSMTERILSESMAAGVAEVREIALPERSDKLRSSPALRSFSEGEFARAFVKLTLRGSFESLWSTLSALGLSGDGHLVLWDAVIRPDQVGVEGNVLTIMTLAALGAPADAGAEQGPEPARELPWQRSR